MISVDNLYVEFSAVPLLEDVNFVINPRDRIALVGKNGAGKSTLLKILSGSQAPTSGRVSMPTDTIVGYLPQVMQPADDTTVHDEAQKAFSAIEELELRVRRLEETIANRTDYDSQEYMGLLERYTTEHERLMMMAPEEREANIEKTLVGLGFTRDDFSRPTSEFSGGWRMRVEIAKLLLRKPDVLLLDEPTNHLDIESIQWLENFLIQSASAVVVVSHDRAFVNNVTNRTMEISCRRIVDYRVKYDEFVKLRRERREQQLRAYENQQREIAGAQEFINRFRYKPSKAVQVQQKIKQLSRITPIEIDEEDTSLLHLKFPPCQRSGDYPIIAYDVAKAWGDNLVFSDVSFTIHRGEKVAFVGKNGEGKTTMVRCIISSDQEADREGKSTFYKGTVRIGHNIQIGYFAQNQAQLLDENLTVFDTIDRVARGEIRVRIKNILGAFMFGGDDIEKKVKVLSGGERTRLAMIRLLLEPVNFLILDEPTNHLDMESKDVLKEAIRAFDGTAIIVSHDREFLDGLVEKVYEFGGGQVKEFMGGIYDFLRSRNVSELGMLSTPSVAEVDQKKLNHKKETPTTHTTDYQVRKELQRRLTKLKREIDTCEKKILAWQTRIDELDDILSQAENASRLDLVNEYTTLRKNIDQEEARWTQLAEEIGSIKI